MRVEVFEKVEVWCEGGGVDERVKGFLSGWRSCCEGGGLV